MAGRGLNGGGLDGVTCFEGGADERGGGIILLERPNAEVGGPFALVPEAEVGAPLVVKEVKVD